MAAVDPEAVERSQAYIHAQDAFHAARNATAYHVGTGNHLPGAIYMIRSAGFLVLMGRRSLALVEVVNEQKLKVPQKDDDRGPTRALAEGIIARSEK